MADATVRPVLLFDAVAAAAAASSAACDTARSQQVDDQLRQPIFGDFCRNSASFSGDGIDVGGRQIAENVVEARTLLYDGVEAPRYSAVDDDAKSDDETYDDAAGTIRVCL